MLLPISGRAVFPDEVERKFRAQAVTNDVVNGSTVSIIDAATNQTVASTITDANGNFQSLRVQDNGAFDPSPAPASYFLDAIKGLANPPGSSNYNAAGAFAPRMRTIIQWTGSAWQSIAFCTSGSTNYTYITPDTTAISIIVSERRFTAANAIGTISVATNCGSSDAVNKPTFNSYAGGDSDIAPFSEGLVLNLVNTVLGTNNADPVGWILYRNGTFINQVLNTAKSGANVTTLVKLGSTTDIPKNLTFDGDVNVYFTVSTNTIRKLNKSTGALCTLVTTAAVATTCTAASFCSVCASSVSLSTPLGIAFDSSNTSTKSGFLYFADSVNNALKKVDISALTASGGTGAISTLVSSLSAPRGLVFDGSNSLYFSEANTVKNFPIGGSACTLAQNAATSSCTGLCANCWIHGTASTLLTDPQGLAFDPVNNALYIAGGTRHTILKLDVSGANANLTQLAGIDGTSGYIDGAGTAANCTSTGACFNNPTDVAYDWTGFLYITDKGNNRIRRMHLTDNAVSTLAGDGTADDQDAALGSVGAAAKINFPSNLIFDGLNMYVSALGASGGAATAQSTRIKKIE